MRRVTSFLVMLAGSLFLVESSPAADGPASLDSYRRIVFLGDSNTYAGRAIEYVEAYLRLKRPNFHAEVWNLGLPSETVSGLSEPGHAGGAFPRPELAERLDRVLEKTKPDLIVACYGMNCGMYYPYSEERLAKFQKGIRHLRERAAVCGAKVSLVTPPVFDPSPIRAKTLPVGLSEYPQPYEGYDDFLSRASAWLLEQKPQGWDVVDVHGPMSEFLARERTRNPDYRLADDGVHINAIGHGLIARALLTHWGLWDDELGDGSKLERFFTEDPQRAAVLKLVERRQRMLKDSWLTATGHKRPGMNRGLPLPEAQREAGKIEADLRKLLGRSA